MRCTFLMACSLMGNGLSSTDQGLGENKNGIGHSSGIITSCFVAGVL